jgi:hypothetical protein
MTNLQDVEVYAVLIDKFGRKYRKLVQIASNGLMVIDLTDIAIFPQFLINAYAGIFQLIVEDAEGFAQPFEVNLVNYDGLEFEVENVLPIKDGFLIDVYNTPVKEY